MGALLALALLASVDLGPLHLGPEDDRAQVGQVLYVALQAGGVVVVDVTATPRVVGRFAQDRHVVRLLAQRDQLVLIEAQYAASAWSLADPRAPIAAPL